MIQLTKKEIEDLNLQIFLTPDRVYQVDFLLVSEKSKAIKTIQDGDVSELFFMCHQLCHASKNLYNSALYAWRKQFLNNKTCLTYETLDKLLKNSQEYRSLPAKVSQQTLKLLSQNMNSFFGLIKSEKLTQEEKNKIKLPRYYPSNKFKPDGLTVVAFTNQAISKKSFQQGKILLSGTGLEIELSQFKMIHKLMEQNKFDFNHIQQVRIIPKSRHFDKNHFFKIEIIYAKKLNRENNTVQYFEGQIENNPADILNYTDKGKFKQYNKFALLEGDFSEFAAIDVNVNDLAVVTRENSTLWNLKPIKSINQSWNKKVAKWKSQLDFYKNQLSLIKLLAETDNNPLTKETIQLIVDESKLKIKKLTNRIKRITTKRNRCIESFIHKLSRQLINHLYQLGVRNIIFGKNVNFKKEINLGRKNNQNFVQIPFNKIIEKCKYKAHLLDMNFFTVEESYTSKMSFLEKEVLYSYKNNKPHKDYQFFGVRKSRGLFFCKDGTHIHADRNGAYNIARKVMGQAIYQYVDLQSIKGSCPTRINVKL